MCEHKRKWLMSTGDLICHVCKKKIGFVSPDTIRIKANELDEIGLERYADALRQSANRLEGYLKRKELEINK